MRLPDHSLNVETPYYRLAFERFRALAIELGQLETVRPYLARAESMTGREAFACLHQAAMAQAMDMSLATLKRRLRAEGRSYRKIVQEVRLVLVYEYLVMSPVVIKEVAYLLHYDNPGNFVGHFAVGSA